MHRQMCKNRCTAHVLRRTDALGREIIHSPATVMQVYRQACECARARASAYACQYLEGQFVVLHSIVLPSCLHVHRKVCRSLSQAWLLHQKDARKCKHEYMQTNNPATNPPRHNPSTTYPETTQPPTHPQTHTQRPACMQTHRNECKRIPPHMLTRNHEQIQKRASKHAQDLGTDQQNKC